jgi:hypothetical protein
MSDHALTYLANHGRVLVTVRDVVRKRSTVRFRKGLAGQKPVPIMKTGFFDLGAAAECSSGVQLSSHRA